MWRTGRSGSARKGTCSYLSESRSSPIKGDDLSARRWRGYHIITPDSHYRSDPHSYVSLTHHHPHKYLYSPVLISHPSSTMSCSSSLNRIYTSLAPTLADFHPHKTNIKNIPGSKWRIPQFLWRPGVESSYLSNSSHDVVRPKAALSQVQEWSMRLWRIANGIAVYL